MIPPWIVDDLSAVLDPPAIIARLAYEVPHSGVKTLFITRTLLGPHAAGYVSGRVPADLIPPRYQPHDNGTRCNLFVSDVAQLHGTPLPHRWFTDIGSAKQWMSANDMNVALKRNLYPGWSRVEPSRLGELDIVERTALGLPTVASWFNHSKRPDGSPASGHIVWVVPTPPGRAGIYVTGAGRTCVEQCPIAQAFGSHVGEVEFYGHGR